MSGASAKPTARRHGGALSSGRLPTAPAGIRSPIGEGKFTDLGVVSDDGLLKTARIVHEAYRSYDLAGLLLRQHDLRTGGDLNPAYLGRFGG